MKTAIKVVAVASTALAAISLFELQPAIAQTIAPAASIDAPRAPYPSSDIQVGFSPEGTAYPLVLNVIHSAHRTLHVMAYEMKEPGIIRALEEQARRGVDVEVEVDYKENLGEGSSDYTRERLAELATSGVHVCVISAFPIFHDKALWSDSRNLEVGSFNYTRQAKERNSENAIVFWNRPDIAAIYEGHFRSRLSVCQPYHG